MLDNTSYKWGTLRDLRKPQIFGQRTVTSKIISIGLKAPRASLKIRTFP